MSFAEVEAIADAILYEGYMLYPYRRSSLKNRGGWTFGVIPPLAPTQPGRSTLRCHCLVVSGPTTEVEAKLRFLLPRPEAPGGDQATPCEVTAASVRLPDLDDGPVFTPFTYGPDGEALAGRLELASTFVAQNVHWLSVTVSNLTAASGASERSQLRSMVSTHVLLGLRAGEFVPPREPPPSLAAIAEAGRQEGLWPILAGERGRRDLLLCSPIILEDYPEVAPESPGGLFDATEIDEILTLRILTLARDEKDEIARGDPRVAALIRRIETLTPAQLAQLHGTVRATPRPGPGDRVRLRPAKRADIMDIALAGRLATIVSVERDLEDRTYFAVTVDDDPGKDLGALGKPAHRFFFGPDEVELVLP